MQIQKLQAYQFSNIQSSRNTIKNNLPQTPEQPKSFAKIPYNFTYNANIHFGEFFDPNRTVPHINYEEYMAMTENTKQRYRKKYASFFMNELSKEEQLNKKELIDEKSLYMPLKSEALMDEFLNVAKVYSKYKENPIICLGRSPKWFLNASLWMKGGIKDYKFVAFSNSWYDQDPFTKDIIRRNKLAPTPEEEEAFRKYLKRVKADPQTIVNHMKKTGKRTVITDYIDTGKGVTSFLDLMSKYAEDLGILKEFCESIHIVGIGSLTHEEKRLKHNFDGSSPKVIMPDRMLPYEKKGLWTYNITQEFHDMDYNMFKEMLLNQNTNECRSTYYPHKFWTIFQPDRVKIGISINSEQAKDLVKKLKKTHAKTLSSFTPAMYDYRNLLNFRILDALNTRNLLKAIHKSKV